MEKLFTVDNIAEMTGLTSRTIRNYIADGRLKGRKIGSQWRFTEADIEALFSASGVKAAPVPQETAEDGTASDFLRVQRRDGIVVCAVVDYPAPYSDTTDGIFQMLKAAAEDYDDDELELGYEYFAEVSIGRFTFTGDIDAVSKMIKVIRKKG